jgi:hypothetical protein
MKKAICLAALLAATPASATTPATSVIYNPISQMTLTATTTARGANTIVSNGSPPSWSIPTDSKSGLIPRIRFDINDATSTGWGNVSIQIDLWGGVLPNGQQAVPPVLANGDGGAWGVTVGAREHLGAYSCVLSAVGADGVYAECAPVVGNVAAPVVPGSTIWWTLQVISPTGVVGASAVATAKLEIVQ